MARATPIDKLESAIDKILTSYGDDVQKNVDEATVKVGRAGASALRSESKKTFGGTGKYAKGWKAKTEQSRLGTTAIIYNTNPGLPHLLENGHAKRGGGRVPGRKHIAPVEEKIIDKFTKAVKEAVHDI